MMVYNENENRFLSKGTCILDVKHLSKNGSESPYKTRFCVFDIVYLNGQDLTGVVLIERLKILRSNISSNRAMYVLNDLIIAACTKSGLEKVKSILKEQTDQKQEGLILKGEMSKYVPNGRNSAGWYKLKPDYIDSLADDLDLLLIGGSFGNSNDPKRKCFIDKFGVAVKIDNRKFETVALLSSRFKNADINFLNDQLFVEEKTQKSMPKEWLRSGKKSEKCDYYFKKVEDCIIIQVRVAEVNVDKNGKYGLRFPRVISIRKREEKSWMDACTIEDLSKICREKKGYDHVNNELKKNSDTIVFSESPEMKVIETKFFNNSSPVGEVRSISCNLLCDSPNILSTNESNKRLNGMEICLMLNVDDSKRENLKTLIEVNGGQCVAMPSKSRTTFVVMDGDRCSQVTGLRSRRIFRDFKVVSAEWLEKYISNDQFDFSIFPNEFTRHQKNTIIGEKLQMEFREIKTTHDTQINFELLKKMGIECGKYRGMRVYNPTDQQSQVRLWMIGLKLNGGRMVDNFEEASHVLSEVDNETIMGKCTLTEQQIIDQMK